MTSVTGTNSGPIEAPGDGSAVGADDAALNPINSADAPGSWQELRSDSDIQFEQIEIPPIPPREPGRFEEALQSLADFFSPLGGMFGGAWPILRWVFLALLIAAVLFIIWRMFGPLTGLRARIAEAEEEIEWQPDRAQSLALLEDADKLAADGRYDEAVHLLLQRSVGQIASARPDWVVPSSTARELAALPALSDAARAAFRTIAERVEQSLFALRSLDAGDWEAARKAYADFALAKIEGSHQKRNLIDRDAAAEAGA